MKRTNVCYPLSLTPFYEEAVEECDVCGGDPEGRLFMISNCDPSVGYHETLRVCADCKRHAKKSVCGSCL